MNGDDVTPLEGAQAIKIALAQLGARNGYFLFEDLCREFFRARVSSDVLPATGPVGAEGDQGSDFETFFSLSAQGERIVGTCTIQASRLKEKIKSDIGKVAADGNVAVVYAFCAADIPVGTRHRLIKFARERYGMQLEIIDGRGLAEQLAQPDLSKIAARLLSLPPALLGSAGLESTESQAWAKRVCTGLPRPELHRYLQSVQSATQKHPYGFPSGLSLARMPALADVYHPQNLTELTPPASGHAGTGERQGSPSWTALLERHRNLLVRGGPGAGKSTLLRHIAASLAQDALAGHPANCFPILLRAQHLTADTPLVKTLHEAATRSLGPALAREIPEGIFEAAPLPGVCWLVLVDGLDEIRDHEKREDALRALMYGLDEPAWRFVVATRPLPDDDLCELRSRFGECELCPITGEGLRKFATRWMSQLADHDTAALVDRIDEHAQLMGYDGLTRTPLVAAMLCTLVAHAPADPLPASSASLYAQLTDLLQMRVHLADDSIVRSLQEQCMTLLEDIAFEHHLGDWEHPLLEAALQWAKDHDLHPAPSMSARWNRIVHDVLCETGLVISDGNDITFSHATFEEFLAARHMYRALTELTSQGLHQEISEFLWRASDIYGSYGEFLCFSNSFCFLTTMWAAGGRDPDSLVAEILEAPAASRLIDSLVGEGIQLGDKVTAALVRIAGDWREAGEDRVNAANALATLDSRSSVALLLAITVDHDVDEEERLAVTRSLAHSSPPVAAAIAWLTITEYWTGPDTHYRAEAICEVTGGLSDEEAERAGLEIIATNHYLDYRYRVSAGATLAEKGGTAGYLTLRSLIPTKTLTVYLFDAAEQGNLAALSSLSRLAFDASLDAEDRFDAADTLALFDHAAGVAAFKALASDQILTTDQRFQAAAQAAALTIE